MVMGNLNSRIVNNVKIVQEFENIVKSGQRETCEREDNEEELPYTSIINNVQSTSQNISLP